ncbi:hypothetical protein BFP76_13710 [Amylibacter kogurei]|uniref:SlyX protein n=1 Tax=Paramylibacter kogurei TaxID=1889778 RepID=A0A2G5K9B6_9RHOB|nr:SlyX family protein [Amylibacter kogurei]PIB26025.1 hypothetical protein BFP76_13710 [Amylibacter kogurei]
MEPTQDIIDLQIKLSEAQRMMDELSDIVADQAKRLEIAEQRIQMLMERAADAEAQAMNGVALGDAKPPHW